MKSNIIFHEFEKFFIIVNQIMKNEKNLNDSV